MDRRLFAELFRQVLQKNKEYLYEEFHRPDRIPSCCVDDVLENSLAEEIFHAFPNKQSMYLRTSLREKKYISSQMSRHNSLLEEVIFGFQDPKVTSILSEITGIKILCPDETLWAAGVSLMSNGHFLRPHLDNSHDGHRKQYRVLNLLFYVTPNWMSQDGGNLELWDFGFGQKPRVLHNKFNRLVIMGTTQSSWHSVGKVMSDKLRCCVSNYLFSPVPPGGLDYFHVTSFRGRPEEPVQDVLLRLDGQFRRRLRTFFPKGIKQSRHVYKRN